MMMEIDFTKLTWLRDLSNKKLAKGTRTTTPEKNQHSELPYEPAIQFLNTYSHQTEDTSTQKLVYKWISPISFTLAKNWKQLKCLSINELIKHE